MKIRRWRSAALFTLLLVVIVLLVGLLVRHRHTNQGDENVSRVVRTAAIAVRDVPVFLNAVGTVTPSTTVTVRAQVQGTLASINFREGQVVARGDLLATIDDRALRAQLETAEGALLRDRAQLANARRDLDRTRALVDIGSASRQQLDTQETAVRQAEGIVKADLGSVGNLRVQLSYTRITAPIDGVVGLRAVDPGNLVQPGDANGVATLASISPTTVKFALPVDQLSRVLNAQRHGAVRVDALDRDGGNVLAEGTLEAVDNRVDAATGTVMLRARFDDSEHRLFPNQFVSARVHLETLDKALVVPLSAIRSGNQGAYVFIINDGKAHLQNVMTGPTLNGQSVIVAEAIKPGMQVAVDGIDALDDGAAVRVVTSSSRTDAEPSP
ncbi:efflux RND transporter periplasmic adaptor subunit [Pseudomonas aeruginosa]|uniref:efflux RND transporter periplasmic adaptor subunit n=1 Tax=Stenotrophomonas maltophilia TaxID=40324 RepID=UPI001EF9421A|nr:efflux RND transporter periplasmic adaptor subunit [Stenotrophomonas maltophilia]